LSRVTSAELNLLNTEEVTAARAGPQVGMEGARLAKKSKQTAGGKLSCHWRPWSKAV